jgi:uncharacterized membrane-anchored protein
VQALVGVCSGNAVPLRCLTLSVAAAAAVVIVVVVVVMVVVEVVVVVVEVVEVGERVACSRRRRSRSLASLPVYGLGD